MKLPDKARAGNRSRRASGLLRHGLTAHGVLCYVFLYLPILVLVAFSFNASRYSGLWRGFTLQWYEALFSNAALGAALRTSLVVALASTAISTVLGTAVALGLERFAFRFRPLMDVLLYLPIIIPDIAMAVMLLLFFVLTRVPLGVGTIVVSHVAFNVSYVALVVRARLAYFDISLEEAAQDLYADEWQTFRRVTLPLLMPGILGGALLAFTLSLDDFVIAFFVSGPGATTLPLRVYSMIKLGVTPEINALSSLMLLASIGLIALSGALSRR